MSERIENIVSRLPGMESVTAVWDTAERSVAEGDVAFVADLGVALAHRYAARAAEVWQYRSVFDRLLRLLTTTRGRDHVVQAVRLVSAAGSTQRKLPRYAASLLAEGQTPRELAPVFAGGSSQAGASEELRACLVHELVLRGVPVTEVPEIARWARSPHWRHHPLAWLPLERSVLEEEPPLPSYSVGGSSFGMPYGPHDGPGVPLGRVAKVPAATETTAEDFVAAAAAAVSNWAEESNGRIEARAYDLAEPVESDAVAHLLVALGLECLDGVGPRKRLALSSCEPEDVWETLFAAASTGGAYNNGGYGAYGRLAAWRSLAALSGTSAQAPFGEVERNARRCDWYRFDAASGWFHDVAWDVGVVCVAPGRRRLAVLAATDTD